ncbi:MAG: hypothetical protein JXA78_19695, partial [Anaerolineales bacterium]|nr:hypothetical protein [Anaerolineales bacterium]
MTKHSYKPDEKQLKLEFPSLSRNRELVIRDTYHPGADITLFHGDRLDFLKQIAAANSFAELIVTSPPYNIGKEYEKQTSLEEYIQSQRETIAACVEILS